MLLSLLFHSNLNNADTASNAERHDIGCIPCSDRTIESSAFARSLDHVLSHYANTPVRLGHTKKKKRTAVELLYLGGGRKFGPVLIGLGL